jgi:hypothetical protein
MRAKVPAIGPDRKSRSLPRRGGGGMILTDRAAGKILLGRMRRARRFSWFQGGVLLGLAVLFGAAPAAAFSTGVPAGITFEPPTLRQGEHNAGTVTATVTLTEPSPVFFVCVVRSTEPRIVGFSPIIFAKGQLTGKCTGAIHWSVIDRDSSVKVSAFSADDPNLTVWASFSLKVQPAEPDSE